MVFKNTYKNKEQATIVAKQFEAISDKAVKTTIELVFPKAFVKESKNGKSQFVTVDLDKLVDFISFAKDKNEAKDIDEEFKEK